MHCPLREQHAERAADGSVLLPLDEDGLRALVPVLRARRIESIAVGFLHSYVDPAHEERARDVLRAAMPEAAVTISSEVCREIREYERVSTTIANAYVLPLMDRYIAAMRAGLGRLPRLFRLSLTARLTLIALAFDGRSDLKGSSAWVEAMTVALSRCPSAAAPSAAPATPAVAP